MLGLDEQSGGRKLATTKFFLILHGVNQFSGTTALPSTSAPLNRSRSLRRAPRRLGGSDDWLHSWCGSGRSGDGLCRWTHDWLRRLCSSRGPSRYGDWLRCLCGNRGLGGCSNWLRRLCSNRSLGGDYDLYRGLRLCEGWCCRWGRGLLFRRNGGRQGWAAASCTKLRQQSQIVAAHFGWNLATGAGKIEQRAGDFRVPFIGRRQRAKC
jgi:hypothetical protein